MPSYTAAAMARRALAGRPVHSRFEVLVDAAVLALFRVSDRRNRRSPDIMGDRCRYQGAPLALAEVPADYVPPLDRRDPIEREDDEVRQTAKEQDDAFLQALHRVHG